MQPGNCVQCTSMRGWNGRYILHRLVCRERFKKSPKLLIVSVVLSILTFARPTPSVFFLTDPEELQGAALSSIRRVQQENPVIDAKVRNVESFLRKYKVQGLNRLRVAQSIARISQKYGMDAQLIASIVVVESRGNPFAISASDAIGVMQIHLPTWGQTAAREGLNLFKVEDNIELGVRILNQYTRQFGQWEAVKRYRGWNPEDPLSIESAGHYLAKVQQTYFMEPSVPPVAPVAALQ